MQNPVSGVNQVKFSAAVIRPDLTNAVMEIMLTAFSLKKKPVLVLFTLDRELIPFAKKMGLLTVYKKKSQDEIIIDSQDRRPHYTMYKMQDFAKIYREVALK